MARLDLSLLLDGRVVLKQGHDKAFLNRLLHRVAVEWAKRSIRLSVAEEFEHFILGGAVKAK